MFAQVYWAGFQTKHAIELKSCKKIKIKFPFCLTAWWLFSFGDVVLMTSRDRCLAFLFVFVFLCEVHLIDLPQVVDLCSSFYVKNERRSRTNERRSPHWTPTKAEFEKVYKSHSGIFKTNNHVHKSRPVKRRNHFKDN